MQYAEPALERRDARGEGGLEVEAPSSVGADRSDSAQVHSYLTAKFGTLGEAATCAKALQGTTFDKKGERVEVIHKRAKAHRPAHTTRRGEALAPNYKELHKGLEAGRVVGADSPNPGKPGVDATMQ